MATLVSSPNQGALYGVPAQEASGYSTESSKNSTIANEKRARKAVEEDAARLHNRVRSLQKGERKAEKRLEETRHKARDIIDLRAQNELRQVEREQRQQQLQVHYNQVYVQVKVLQHTTLTIHMCVVGRACCTAARSRHCKGEKFQEKGEG